MEFFLDQIMPVENGISPDLIAGLPDFTFGRASQYFSQLTEEDRELVQWYLLHDIGPREVSEYARELVSGYAVVDPERSFEEGKQAARSELDRIKRFFDIFIASEEFFPLKVAQEIPVDDGEGGEYFVHTEGWLGLMSRGREVPGVLSMEEVREEIVIDEVLILFSSSGRFIDDPSDRGTIFDQEVIMANVKQRRAALDT